jgi:hypothetical protein
MDIEVKLATSADDGDIRRLLATNPIPGQVTVTYEREPDYFLGCQTMGNFYQVVIGRQQPEGELVGLGCRATRPLFINGQVEEVGYLSQLRIDRKYQGRWLVPLGYRYMQKLHADGRVAGYLTTIIEENVRAIGVLVEKARGPIPRYREFQRLQTLAILLRRPRRLPVSAYKLERGCQASLGEVVTFLRHEGAAKQFFPAYTEADFQQSPATLDFQVEDFILARQGGRLAGVIGLWDQSRYKQMRVQAYEGSLARLRPCYNLGLRIVGARPLPPPGQTLRFAYASFICVAGNRPDIFQLLLAATYNLAAERGYTYLMAGLADNDPLLAEARRYRHIPYPSRLYTVCWPEGERWHERLDGRIPYVEIATL